MDNEKRCPRCGQVKSLDEFGLNKSKPDGHSDYCKECAKEMSRESYYRTKERKSADAEKAKLEERKSALLSYSTEEIIAALEGRGITVIINPTPRKLIDRLVDMGYTGTLEFYEKKTVNLATIKN